MKSLGKKSLDNSIPGKNVGIHFNVCNTFKLNVVLSSKLSCKFSEEKHVKFIIPESLLR